MQPQNDCFLKYILSPIVNRSGSGAWASNSEAVRVSDS